MTRDIFIDDRALGDHHFRAMIALKTALFQEDSSRHTSRFEVRSLRRFLKVIFLHLISALRASLGVVVHYSDNLLVCIHIDDI